MTSNGRSSWSASPTGASCCPRSVGDGEREQLWARLVLLRSRGERTPFLDEGGERPRGVVVRRVLSEAVRRPLGTLKSFGGPAVLERRGVLEEPCPAPPAATRRGNPSAPGGNEAEAGPALAATRAEKSAKWVEPEAPILRS